MRLERFEIGEDAETRDGQVFVNGRGLHSGKATRVLVPEAHGFASQPVPGGMGIVGYLNGDPESPVLLGQAAPGKRPEIGTGGTAIYDASGAVVSIVNRAIRLVGDSVTLVGPVQIDGDVTLNGNLSATGSVVDGDGDGGA